jgi:putative SOS response-associated peptidase YedK
MCGRFQMDERAFSAAARIARIPKYIEVPLMTIYPSKPSLVLTGQDPVGELADFGWLMKDGKRLINARAETVLEKPLFAKGLRQPCIVPASRFYEWKNKIPCAFLPESGPVLYMAGLLEENAFVILTTQANASVLPWHHRMPLVFDEQEALAWMRHDLDLLALRPGPLREESLQPRLF